MILEYILKLGLKIFHTNVRAQKIDGFIFKMFGIVLPSFQVKNKRERAYFFQKILLLANINIEVILKIFFFTVSNTNIQFAEKKLI